MGNTIRHIGLVVENVDKALDFYGVFLGFSVVKDQWETGPFIDAVLGMPGLRVRTIKMMDAGGAILELLCFDLPPEACAGREIHQPGFSHIALTVQDVDRLFEGIKALGLPFISSPKVSGDGRAKVVFCRDPQGNFLELVQELG
ncbi:MAG: VOC family protein [Candidatus Omnitrophica bacterium]|nr:VOC family protein [Candidatus Omnitrophota bacterium]